MNHLQIKAESVRSDAGVVRFRVTLLDGDDIQCQTTMTIEDFVSLIRKSQKQTELSSLVRIGQTPVEMYDGFKSVTTNPLSIGGIFYLKPQKHQFLLNVSHQTEPKAYYLPMPGLVYTIAYINGHRAVFTCHCYNGDWQGDDTVLYQYPFGNVDSNGRICMGSIQTKTPENFQDLREIIEDSLLGITNDDYLGGQGVRLSCSMSQEDFCDSIKDDEEFPHHLLLASNVGASTVGKLTDSFFLTYGCL